MKIEEYNRDNFDVRLSRTTNQNPNQLVLDILGEDGRLKRIESYTTMAGLDSVYRRIESLDSEISPCNSVNAMRIIKNTFGYSYINYLDNRTPKKLSDDLTN